MVSKSMHCLNSLTNCVGRPWLLHTPAPFKVEKGKARQRDALEEETPHRDERQIRLDTDRSFVLYPVGEILSNPAFFWCDLLPTSRPHTRQGRDARNTS